LNWIAVLFIGARRVSVSRLLFHQPSFVLRKSHRNNCESNTRRLPAAHVYGETGDAEDFSDGRQRRRTIYITQRGGFRRRRDIIRILYAPGSFFAIIFYGTRIVIIRVSGVTPMYRRFSRLIIRSRDYYIKRLAYAFVSINGVCRRREVGKRFRFETNASRSRTEYIRFHTDNVCLTCTRVVLRTYTNLHFTGTIFIPICCCLCIQFYYF